ncbi:hypothetical protein BU23DRAFT_647703 [Bimuria novae-zelandiae CBS 107.79]|uniref:Uncharacterized protein n=1 Tax=Bimuria novae-zelandiae CBS 107.79 TaxID=1447943 RepID=A0A6A5W0S9_9PLEO|nr:hypothetical protein BU23DRAFT_647703 [Bimuria novae-zelandiae CBS 107.79]
MPEGDLTPPSIPSARIRLTDYQISNKPCDTRGGGRDDVYINDVKSAKGSSRADAFVIDDQDSDTDREDEHQPLGDGGDTQADVQPTRADTSTTGNLSDGTSPRVVGGTIEPQVVTGASSLYSPPPSGELAPILPKRTVNNSPFGTSGNGDTITSVNLSEDLSTMYYSQPTHPPRVPIGAKVGWQDEFNTFGNATLGSVRGSDSGSESNDSDYQRTRKRKRSQTTKLAGRKRRSGAPNIASAPPRKSLSRRHLTPASSVPSDGTRYGSDGSDESGEESDDQNHGLQRNERRKLLAGYESLRKRDRNVAQPLRSKSKGSLPSTGETGPSIKYVAPSHAKQYPPDISIYPLSLQKAFVTALFRDHEDIGTVQAAGLLKDIVGHLELRSITAKPVEPGTWFLTCFTHHASDTLGRQISQPSPEEDDWSNSRDIDEKSLGDDDANSDENDEYPREPDTKFLSSTKGRRWSPEEDNNLRKWKNEGKPWRWICSQFPNRTPGALSTRWHTKLRPK